MTGFSKIDLRFENRYLAASRRKPLIYTSTSPIYGGGARRAEGGLAKVALIVSGNILQPLRGKTPPLASKGR